MKHLANFLPKIVANFGEDLFFWVFIQFRRRKYSYIISTKLFVKLVKAAKASPHAKFYNLSTAVNKNVSFADWQFVPTYAWISGDARVDGNGLADNVAKSGSKSKCMVLNLLLQYLMPAVLTRLRIGPQIDRNLCGITEGLSEDKQVCSRLGVFSTNNTSL